MGFEFLSVVWPYLAYIGIGLFSGFLAGLMGVGGGIVIVPLLSSIFYFIGIYDSLIMHLAIGTSLAAMIFTTQSSLRAHARRGNAPHFLLKRIVPSVILGVGLGILLARYLSTTLLEIFFGIFLLLIGLWMISGFEPREGTELPKHSGFYVVMTFIGMLSGILGIGGGTLVIPFLTRHQVSLRQAVGLSSAVGLVTSLVGTIGMILSGWNADHLPPYALGFVYIPAVFGIMIPSFAGVKGGVWLSYRLPIHRLRQFLGFILIVTSIFLVWR